MRSLLLAFLLSASALGQSCLSRPAPARGGWMPINRVLNAQSVHNGTHVQILDTSTANPGMDEYVWYGGLFHVAKSKAAIVTTNCMFWRPISFSPAGQKAEYATERQERRK